MTNTTYRVDRRDIEMDWTPLYERDTLDGAVEAMELCLIQKSYPRLPEREYRIVEVTHTESVLCARNLSKETLSKL